MTTRRNLLKAGSTLVLAGMAGRKKLLAAQAKNEIPVKKTKHLRTITYNVLACVGFRDKTDKRKHYRPNIPRQQMTTRFALELDLYQPDIVSFQESPGEQVVADIAKKLGFRHHCFFASGEKWPGAIMSRYRIVEFKNCPLKSFEKRPAELFTRHWGRAVLETEKGPLVVYSAHLMTGWAPQPRRELEIAEMLKVMATDIQSNRSVLFQGDLNHMPDGTEYKRWIKAGLIDAFTHRGVGQPNTVRSNNPQWRVDYIWTHGPIAGRLRECRVLYEGAFRTNPDDPGSVALSDHLPVMATFD